ncbi:MAG: two-component system sensor histidine kinase NtrB, partial [Thermodesulfobacteriota bacterium]
EQALFESQEKLKNIIENTTDAVIVYDEKGKVMTVNKEATRLFCGNHRERLDQIWDIIPTENRDDFQEKLKNAKRGSRLLDYETEKILENGERISVSVGLVYMKEEGGMFIETIRDIRERLVLRSKIVEIEKSQVMGKLAEGIAHHMGTPLASMLLRVQMLKEDIPKIGNYIDIMEKLESIERQILYGKKVMQRLLRFTRKPENVTRPENVALMIEEAVEMLNPLFKKTGIELESSVDSGPRILADVDLIELVFSDIMTNAVDAMPEGGKIFLSVKNGTEKDMVEIIISDTGSGIPEQILPLVFEPFFSTKPAGKGTGLGLSVARRIIHDHGGEISIESIDGEGTSIRIQIPLYEEG